jgi:hypothetical protein
MIIIFFDIKGIVNKELDWGDRGRIRRHTPLICNQRPGQYFFVALAISSTTSDRFSRTGKEMTPYILLVRLFRLKLYVQGNFEWWMLSNVSTKLTVSSSGLKTSGHVNGAEHCCITLCFALVSSPSWTLYHIMTYCTFFLLGASFKTSGPTCKRSAKCAADAADCRRLSL